MIKSQLCAALYSVYHRSDIFTHTNDSLAISTPGHNPTSNYTSLSPGSESRIKIELISAAAAAAGFLLIVAAVGIYWIYRRHRKTDQEGKGFPLLTQL